MAYLIATADLEPQPIVSIRDRRRQEELPGFLKTAFPALFERLRLLGIGPSGPPLVVYHDFGAEGVDAEVSVPIGEPVAAAVSIECRVLPAMTVARTVHAGSYEKLGDAHAALSDWISAHGFTAAGPVQERYLNGPGEGVGPNQYRTEIEIPIVPLVVAAPA